MPLLRLNRTPSSHQLLVFALAWWLALAACSWAAWSAGYTRFAATLLFVALALPIAWGIARPIVRHVFVGLSLLTFPIGFALSHVILALLYFAVLTPIGWAMRLAGYDPLQRAFEPAAKTYWQARRVERPVSDYFRQR